MTRRHAREVEIRVWPYSTELPNTWFRNTFNVIKYTDRFYIFFHFYGILKMFHSVANKLNIEIK